MIFPIGFIFQQGSIRSEVQITIWLALGFHLNQVEGILRAFV